ncbi:5568_t:CDS:2 [Rhizophagus irregularis]|nr:5568_t:CDS:2 [Rhizophagus irregularis]
MKLCETLLSFEILNSLIIIEWLGDNDFPISLQALILLANSLPKTLKFLEKNRNLKILGYLNVRNNNFSRINELIPTIKEVKKPWWFSTLRRTIALSLIFLLLIYGLSRLKDVAAFLNSPNILIVEHKNVANFPGFIICPESSSPKFILDNESQVDPQFSITCGFSTIIGPEILSENMNITDNDCSSLISKAENGCLRFQPDDKYVDSINEKDDNAAYNEDFGNGEIPLQSLGFNQSLLFFNIQPNIQSEIPSFYTLYFEDYLHQETDSEPVRYSVKDLDNYFIEYTNILINSGQKNIIEYSINTHKVFSSSLIGLLNIVPDLFTMEIKYNTKYIQSKETQFILLPKLPHFFRQEIEKFEYHPISLVSTIGGFHSAIIAFYLLLFGMPRIEPWGFLQKHLLRFWCLRRDFKYTLANDYNTEPGIPLVDNIRDIPKEISLEERVQIPSLDDHNYLDLNLNSPFSIFVISPLPSSVFNID